MKSRNELSGSSDSLFEVIDNRQLAFVVGGLQTNTMTITAHKKKKKQTVKDDGADS